MKLQEPTNSSPPPIAIGQRRRSRSKIVPIPFGLARHRGKLLQHVCTLILERKQRGVSLASSAKMFSRIYNGRTLPSGHKLKLNWRSLLRLYSTWLRSGQLESAFHIFYEGCAKSKVSGDDLRAFLKIAFRDGTRSGVHAYQLFAMRRRSVVSFSTLVRHFPRGLFRKTRSAREAIADAEFAFGQLRCQAESYALATLPPAVSKRRRSNPSDHYSI